MRILRWIRNIFAVVLGLLVVVSIGARFSDGPLGILAGGPLVSGERVTGAEPNWDFAKSIDTVEFQLMDPARSRTTWILVHDGKIYIPCGYMNSTWGRIWKQWPIEALEDGRAILRIRDKLYERGLVRIEEGPLLAPLTAELSWKYARVADIGPEAVTSGYLWLFELAPRS